MTVTEQFAMAIIEASNQKFKQSRAVKYCELLDAYFAARLREYVGEKAPEILKEADEQVEADARQRDVQEPDEDAGR
jgi:hypothetical protein